MASVEDLPRKIQYIVIDSSFVNGTNNTFTVDFTLKSNTYVDDMSKVIGLKMVDFYVTQVGENDPTGVTNVAKFIDIVCPEIPKKAQMLDERQSELFARIPLERSFSGSNSLVVRDKQWKPFKRKTVLFNPISIKQLSFKLYEHQGDDDYKLLQPDATFYMILEITTVDHKEKPRDKLVEVVYGIERMAERLDDISRMIKQQCDKMEVEKVKKSKYPFGYFLLLLFLILLGIVAYFNFLRTPNVVAMPVIPSQASLQRRPS